MYSLVLDANKEANIHNDAMDRFKYLDIFTHFKRSGGLYVVEQACKKGLITIVNLIGEHTSQVEEAKKLGAKCFDMLSEDNIIGKNLEYFKSHL